MGINVQFEWTVNIGNVLTAVGLLVGFIAAHAQNIKKLAEIEQKVSLMFSWFQHRVVRNTIQDDE